MQKKTQRNRAKRHQIIRDLLLNKKIKNQKNLKLELEDEGVIVAQATLSRDMKDLEVGRNSETGFLEVGESSNSKIHLKNLYNLAVNSYPSSGIFNKIDIHYLNSPIGKAQEIAFHLEEAFPTIVLKTIVDMTSILVIVDGEEWTKQNSEAKSYREFFQLQITDKKRG